MLLQQTAVPQGNFLMTFASLILIFVIFYFLMIRPQQKQQKKLQAMVAGMRKGDQVITRAGIYGKVTSLDEKTVTVEIANNVNVKMTRDAVVHVAPAQ